jgi:hypothetical protein
LKKDDRASTYDVCKEYFVNNIFSEYTDFMKVISWHKDVVLAVNQKVRQFIYRDTNLPLIMIGEKLLADSPIKDQAGYLIYTTNAEFMVKKVTMDRIEVAPKVFGNVAFTLNVKFYRCLVVGTQLSNPRTYMVEKEIWVIHEDSAALFNAGLDKVKQAILAVDKMKRFGQWSAFYNARDMFAAVKHNYAITAHKCQGSSYENAMVLDWDIRTSSKIEERNRILYTSVTRPRKYLFIIQ